MDEYRKLMDKMARERAERQLATRPTEAAERKRKILEGMEAAVNKPVFPSLQEAFGGNKKLEKTQPSPSKPISPEKRGEMLKDSYLSEEARKEEMRKKMLQEQQERMESGLDELTAPLSPEEEAEQQRQMETFLKTRKMLGR